MPKKREASILIKPTSASDATTTRAIDDLRKEVQARSFLDGARLLEDVELSDGTNRIAHGLGRKPRGYLVTRTRDVVASDVVRLVSSIDMYSYIEATNWDPPGGSQDYWTTLKTNRSLQIPMPLTVGETLKRIDLTMYAAGATDPTVDVYKATTADASASSITPIVSWGSVPTTTWTKIYATFDEVALADYHYYVRIVGPTIGDHFRMAQFTVTPALITPAVTDDNDGRTDLDKFLYLVADGYSATVDLLIF